MHIVEIEDGAMHVFNQKNLNKTDKVHIILQSKDNKMDITGIIMQFSKLTLVIIGEDGKLLLFWNEVKCTFVSDTSL